MVILSPRESSLRSKPSSLYGCSYTRMGSDTHNPTPFRQPHLARFIPQRAGLRISLEIVSALSEMVILMRQTQKAPTTSPAIVASPDMPDMMTVGNVAKLLRLSSAKVYRMLHRKELLAIVISRSLRVRREDLDSFMQKHSAS